jgi:hypothetical protein
MLANFNDYVHIPQYFGVPCVTVRRKLSMSSQRKQLAFGGLDTSPDFEQVQCPFDLDKGLTRASSAEQFNTDRLLTLELCRYLSRADMSYFVL